MSTFKHYNHVLAPIHVYLLSTWVYLMALYKSWMLDRQTEKEKKYLLEYIEDVHIHIKIVCVHSK